MVYPVCQAGLGIGHLPCPVGEERIAVIPILQMKKLGKERQGKYLIQGDPAIIGDRAFGDEVQPFSRASVWLSGAIRLVCPLPRCLSLTVWKLGGGCKQDQDLLSLSLTGMACRSNRTPITVQLSPFIPSINCWRTKHGVDPPQHPQSRACHQAVLSRKRWNHILATWAEQALFVPC